jgi:hypothetical protein
MQLHVFHNNATTLNDDLAVFISKCYLGQPCQGEGIYIKEEKKPGANSKLQHITQLREAQ